MRERSSMRHSVLIVAVGCVLFGAVDRGWADDPSLLTVAEKSEFRATAKSDEVMALCQKLDARSENVNWIELGKSLEGRSIYGMVVAEPPVKTAEEARRSGKVVVLVIGNIHAGEVDGKEALPMLVREYTEHAGNALLKDVVLIVVPNINPDGNDKMAKTNRPGQVGPEDGMGTRENAQKLDLNRDFVKLESPEIQALARCFNEWDPHVFIDTHTTNGSHHRFTITHAGPKSVAGSRALNDFVHLEMLPALNQAMDKDHGWKCFAYGNFEKEHTRWTSFASEPRYGTLYFGLRGGIGLLSEAYAYASYKDRVLATRDFVDEIVRYCAGNAEKVKGQVAAARETKVGVPVAIRAEIRARKEPATVLGFVEERRGNRSVASAEEKDYTVELWDDFGPKESVARPAGYLIPKEYGKALEALRRHGLVTKVLPKDETLKVEAYRVTGITRAERAYQGHRAVLEMTVEPREESRTIPAGSEFVSASGPLGSLAVMLLEPRSEDGLATWNYFDDGLQSGRDFPVVRVASAPAFGSETRVAAAAAGGTNRPAQQRRGQGGSPPVRIGTGLRATFVPGAAGFVRWVDDEHFAQLRDGKAMKVKALTGEAEPMPPEAVEDRSKLGEALAKLPTIDDDQGGSLAARATLDGPHKGAFVQFDDDLYYGTMDGTKGLRLTSTPAPEELAEFSPDGKFVAFVRENDLYVVDVATGTERALTTGGTDRMRFGKADWVYFEEIFDRNWKAFWWSPDSKHVAFLATDASMVPTHHVLVETRGGKRIVEETAYPRAGEPNPQVRLGIAAVAGGEPKYADLSNYSPDSFLISDVGWWPDGSSAYCYGQDRSQTWLDLLKVAPETGATTKVFRETTGAWVESLGPIHVLKDGTFLITSERDGWKQLYRYNADGSLKNRVTEGEWEVRSIARIDEDGGWVYLNGTKDNPIGNNLYRAKLDGSAFERLTNGPGTHAGVLNPKGDLLVDLYSSREQAPKGVLRKVDGGGGEVRALDEGGEDAPRNANGPKTEYVRIKTSDGFEMEGELTLPANLDESGKTKYPVWFTTYGGPHFPQISDSWRGGGGGGAGLMGGLLRDGFILFRLDPRSASGKGAKSAWTAYKKLGVQELADIKEGIEWLKKRPYVDGSRIGMSGHSYGGYMTAFCMTHSDLFAAGIAGAPVTDWRDYDSIYTERYMDTPQNNPEGYEASSVVNAADKLHGKLLILHGSIDDNVSVRNTMRFIHALQQADKDFELMIYPASRHGIGGAHYQRLQREFIKRTLGGPKTE